MVILAKQKERCLARNNEELSLNTKEERIDNALIAIFLGIQVDTKLNWKVISKLLHKKLVEQSTF